MSTQQTLEKKIADAFSPLHYEVINESHMHNVPENSETHFKVIVVTENFEGVPLVKRHRSVNQILENELKEKIHALALQTLTPEEWFEKGGKVADSPPCLGGMKEEQ